MFKKILFFLLIPSLCWAQAHPRITAQSQHPLRHRQESILSGLSTVTGLNVTTTYGIKATDGASGVLTLGGTGGTYNGSISIDFEEQWDGAILTINHPSYDNLTFDADFKFRDDKAFVFGNNSEAKFVWETGGNDFLALTTDVDGAGKSGYISIFETYDFNYGNIANRRPASSTTNPTLRIYSSDDTEPTDYIEMYHDQDNGYIVSGSGQIILDSANWITLDSNGNSQGTVFQQAGTSGLGIALDSSMDQINLFPYDAFGNQVVLTNAANYASDHDHATTTNPTLFIHSDLSPDTSNIQYGGLFHTGDSDDDGGFGLISGSNYITVMNAGDQADDDRIPNSAATDPVLRVYSADDTEPTDYIEMYHDQDDAKIVNGVGSIIFDSASNFHFDSFGGKNFFKENGSDRLRFDISNSRTQSLIAPADDVGNQLILTTRINVEKNHDHATTTNPTLFIHSDFNPDTSNIQYGGLFHTGDVDDDGGFGLISGSNYITVMNAGDQADDDRIPNTAATDPVLRVYSADDTNANDYIEMYHDQDNAIIESGNGDLQLNADESGSSVKIKGDSQIHFIANNGQVHWIRDGETMSIWDMSPSTDQYKIGLDDESGNQVVYTNTTNIANDHDHAVQTNPTLYIHSDESPATAPNDYLALYHDQTFAQIYSPSSITIDTDTNLLIDSANGRFTYLRGGTSGFNIDIDLATNEAKLGFEDNSGNQAIITNDANIVPDHDHAATTNPTLFIHSDLNPDTSNNQWGSFTHDQENFIITTGVNVGTGSGATTDENAIVLAPRGSEGVRVSGAGYLQLTKIWHGYGGFEGQNETVETAAATPNFVHITNAGNNLWNLDEADGITESGDVFTLVNTGDYMGTMTITVSASNGKDFHVQVYNNTQTRVEGRPIGVSSTGAGNEMNVTLPIYIEGTAGDEFQFMIACADATDAVVDDGLFVLTYLHD